MQIEIIALLYLAAAFYYNVLQMNNGNRAICPICKNKLKLHSELQHKVCNMITIKQFANNCPGFDVSV
jgi:hypothetical protein